MHRDVGQKCGVAGRGSVCREYLVNESAMRGSLNQIGPFGKEAPSMTAPGMALQLYRSHHPGGPFSE